MTKEKWELRRIELLYGGVQGSFWLAVCAYSGFLTIYLSSRGFSDSLIGLTSSIMCLLAIFLQLLISSFCDANPNKPLKKIISTGLVACLLFLGVAAWIPMPIALMILFYSLGGGFGSSVNGLLNAQFMQLINAGLPLQFGWPRAMGSVFYAGCALLGGSLIEHYSPAALMPLFAIACLVAIIIIQGMPDANRLPGRTPTVFPAEKGRQKVSLKSILKNNPVFSIFLAASVLIYMGQSASYLFLVRVVEHVGGSGKELGTAMFIQAFSEVPMMLLAPLLQKHFRVQNLLIVAFFAYFLRSFTLMIAGSISLIYLAVFFNMFCYGLYGITSVFFVDHLSRPGEKVRTQSLTVLCGSAAGIISSLISGLVLENFGLQAMLIMLATVTFLGFILMLVCFRMYKTSSPVKTK
ncbi:MAG: MFS transporter [Clostridiales bacterium]|nr:MFS transporter [Clostridiales bacterium]